MRTVISAALVDNGKILIVKKRETWLLPGGKPNSEESDLECLCREISEEIPGTVLTNLIYYQTFQGIAPHYQDQVEVRVYRADVGKLGQAVAAEISEMQWTSDPESCNLSESARKAIVSLRKDGFL